MKMKIAALLASAIVAATTSTRSEDRVVHVTTNEPVPDRVCLDKNSPYFDGRYKRLGVKFNGVDRDNDVQEYCRSEGWLRVRIRNGKGRFIINPDGSYKIARIEGVVEPYWRKLAPAQVASPEFHHDSAGALARAEEKRRRRAEKLARIAGRV